MVMLRHTEVADETTAMVLTSLLVFRVRNFGTRNGIMILKESVQSF